MAALHAQCRRGMFTVRFTVAPEHGMYGSVGEIIDSDGKWARALQSMLVRARDGDVYSRDEFTDFQEYHNMVVTPYELVVPSRPQPTDASTAVFSTRTGDRSMQLERE